jgi:Mlc titration factor MtfA (ptsG expression regulator)
MMFGWFAKRRRRRILRDPFPDGWRAVLRRNSAAYTSLSLNERNRLEDELRIFIADHYWEGVDGLKITDEVRVIIAAEACRLLLGRPGARFRGSSSVVVRPRAYAAGAMRLGSGVMQSGMAAVGTAMHQGPVVLAWPEVLRGARNGHDGRNVVLHEFAHKLDMADGVVDGAPPFMSRDEARRWRQVTGAALARLEDDLRLGLPGPIRAYGASNAGEFFAVSTEAFFEAPDDLHEWDPDLYEVLRDFYRQDPLARRS